MSVRHFCDRCKVEIFKPEYVGFDTYRPIKPGFHRVKGPDYFFVGLMTLCDACNQIHEDAVDNAAETYHQCFNIVKKKQSVARRQRPRKKPIE